MKWDIKELGNDLKSRREVFSTSDPNSEFYERLSDNRQKKRFSCKILIKNK